MAPCTIFAVFGIAFQLYFIVPSFAQLEEFPGDASKSLLGGGFSCFYRG